MSENDPFEDRSLITSVSHLDGLAKYPATLGGVELREAIAGRPRRRHALTAIDPQTHVQVGLAQCNPTLRGARRITPCGLIRPTVAFFYHRRLIEQTSRFRETSPYVNRLRMDRARMREDMLSLFPGPPGLPSDCPASITLTGRRQLSWPVEARRKG